jgi:hypothetical protein
MVSDIVQENKTQSSRDRSAPRSFEDADGREIRMDCTGSRTGVAVARRVQVHESWRHHDHDAPSSNNHSQRNLLQPKLKIPSSLFQYYYAWTDMFVHCTAVAHLQHSVTQAHIQDSKFHLGTLCSRCLRCSALLRGTSCFLSVPTWRSDSPDHVGTPIPFLSLALITSLIMFLSLGPQYKQTNGDGTKTQEPAGRHLPVQR